MKIGIVVEGGGQKGAYSAGVLDFLLENKITFDYCIGVSAGAGNLASFLANQPKRNLRFYRDYAQDKNYWGIYPLIKNKEFLNTRYIYGELSNTTGKDPLDYKSLKKYSGEYVVVATQRQNAKAKYFTLKDFRKNNYLPLMASSAVPVFAKPILIKGAYYYDGGVSDSIPIEKALADGCDKVLIILSRKEGFVMPKEKHKAIYDRKLKKYPDLIKALDNRHVKYNYEVNICERLEASKKAVIIRPTETINIRLFAKDKEAIMKLYQLGYNDTKNQISRIRQVLYA